MADSTREIIVNNLFGGAKFWLAHHIPQRTMLKETIEKHGGVVVLLEKYADVKLVDHLRKKQLADTYSYKYVEKSVRNGKLEDLEDYRAGPSAQRPVGASNIPTKKTRSDYTLIDDQTLFDWLHPYEQEENAPINGNNIYKNLAERFPQHPWQSWRARYLKNLRHKPRPGGGEPRPDLLEHVPALAARSAPPPAAAKPAKPATPEVKQEPSETARSMPNISPPRIPTEGEQIQPSTMPQTRPGESAKLKRKRGSFAGPHENQRDEVCPPPPKRVLAGTPETMDSPAQSVSSTHQTTRKNSLPQTTQPSPTQTSTQKAPTEPRDPQQVPSGLLFLELPFLPSSPEPEVEETDQESNIDVNDWIDAQLGRGNIELSLVLQALQCTSMNPEYAERVLEHCAAGKGIPTDMPGVWTPEDDRCLEAEDGRAVKMVYEKHGEDFFNARWEYLRLARDGGII
ncbi:hypothetical protein N7478_003139 [Penicillium angulare]|uniref:uncharacterized protein n=1 Tax=Penicillium angulare TaxID=116970 RepID=UPI00253F9AF4|nr:uncharacterized protein N7478_003139 [Penicillium angulare]KAJ5287453.1 hypothetical protein N7478_003139 [Penicillium angulare]